MDDNWCKFGSLFLFQTYIIKAHKNMEYIINT